MLTKTLSALAEERSNPSITISMITHKTHPDNHIEINTLKNLFSEINSTLEDEYQLKDIEPLINNLKALEEEIDLDFLNHSQNSLFIFASNRTKEIVRSNFVLSKNSVQIEGSFMLKPLFDEILNKMEYYILLLSKSGAKLFHALNEDILEEIKNEDFPFEENEQFSNQYQKLNSAKKIDDLLSESFNIIDKAMVKLYHQTGMNCVVVGTQDNYAKLSKVADIPSIYVGHVPINLKDLSIRTLVSKSWELIKPFFKKEIKTS